MAVIDEISRGLKIGTMKDVFNRGYFSIYSVDYTETYEPIIIDELDELQLPRKQS